MAENLGELYEEHVGNPEIFEDIFEWISYATYVALAAGCLVTLIRFDMKLASKNELSLFQFYWLFRSSSKEPLSLDNFRDFHGASHCHPGNKTFYSFPRTSFFDSFPSLLELFSRSFTTQKSMSSWSTALPSTSQFQIQKTSMM